nr:hypothetical protein LSAT_V11C500273510 [Lactuca sativa]
MPLIFSCFQCRLETTLWIVVRIIVGYNNKKYYIDIIESKPSNPITIIETDCGLDYKEPKRPHPYHPCHLTKFLSLIVEKLILQVY